MTSVKELEPTTASALENLKKGLQHDVEVIINGFSKNLAVIASNDKKQSAIEVPPTSVPNGNAATSNAATSNAATSNAATSNAYMPKYKSLPWFKHGVRHFLNKLWHGDHPSNPSWQGVQRIEHRLNLQEYTFVKQGISDLCCNLFENLFEEVDEDAESLKNLINQLVSDLTNTAVGYFNKAYELGNNSTSNAPVKERKRKNSTPAPATPATPATPTAPTAATPTPTPTPTAAVPNKAAEPEPEVSTETSISSEEFTKKIANILKNGGNVDAVRATAKLAGIATGARNKITDLDSAFKIIDLFQKLGAENFSFINSDGDATTFEPSSWKNPSNYKKLLSQISVEKETLEEALAIARENARKNKVLPKSEVNPTGIGNKHQLTPLGAASENVVYINNKPSLKHRIQVLERNL